jgi:hypothetical protein
MATGINIDRYLIMGDTKRRNNASEVFCVLTNITHKIATKRYEISMISSCEDWTINVGEVKWNKSKWNVHSIGQMCRCCHKEAPHVDSEF